MNLGSKKTILLVEDNPDDEELTLRSLRSHNVTSRITVARDGEEAVQALFEENRTTELPDLVLLDIKLPKLSGLDVLQQIRGNHRTRLLPVVMLTSSSEEQDIIKSFQSGANSYVRKPVAFEEFQEAVRQLGAYWLTLNQSVHG